MTRLKSKDLPEDVQQPEKLDVFFLLLFALGVFLLVVFWLLYGASPAKAHAKPEPYCSPTVTQVPAPTVTPVATLTPQPTITPSPTAGASAAVLPLAAPDTSLRQ